MVNEDDGEGTCQALSITRQKTYASDVDTEGGLSIQEFISQAKEEADSIAKDCQDLIGRLQTGEIQPQPRPQLEEEEEEDMGFDLFD